MPLRPPVVRVISAAHLRAFVLLCCVWCFGGFVILRTPLSNAPSYTPFQQGPLGRGVCKQLPEVRDHAAYWVFMKAIGDSRYADGRERSNPYPVPVDLLLGIDGLVSSLCCTCCVFFCYWPLVWLPSWAFSALATFPERGTHFYRLCPTSLTRLRVL